MKKEPTNLVDTGTLREGISFRSSLARCLGFIVDRANDMNTPRLRLLALLAVSSLFASLACADESAHAKILRERDAILTQILAEREARYATGGGEEEAVLAARLGLCAFRRDTAPSKAEKIRQQELIVAVCQKKLATVKSRATAGVAGSEEVLLATDSLLQAQQLIEELKLDAKKG